MPPSGKIFIPKTSTLAYLIAFVISTFQLQQFPRYQGGPKFTLRGAMHPDAPKRRNFSTLSEYFTISNSVFNFRFLSLVLYEILGWSQIYIRGRCAPLDAPQRKNFYAQNEHFVISNSIFNFNFLALVVPEILGVPNLHQGAYAPLTPLVEKFLYAKRVLQNI